MPGPLDNLEEAIRELQDLYDDPDIVTTADKIQQPDPREDVKTIDAINAFMQRNPKADGGMLVQPSVDGSRPGYQGSEISFTPKELENINAELPTGIKIKKITKSNKPYYIYTLDKNIKGQRIKTTKAVTTTDVEKDPTLKNLKNDLNSFIKKYLPNALTDEDYEKLRYDNSSLTQEQFVQKLNNEGYTTIQGDRFTRSNVNKKDNQIGLKKGKTYSIKEQKEFLKNSLGGADELRDINSLPISKIEKESLIRKRANAIRSSDNKISRLGSFARTDSRAGKLWHSFYRAADGDRFEIGGTFEGKDLSKRKNWPRDKDGNIDWSKKGPDGEPAWKSATFTDKATPKGEVTFTFNNLQNQVDDAFGKGFFTRSTTAYANQKEYFKNYRGKDLATETIKQEYFKKYKKYPSENYIAQRIRINAPAQVHHFGEGGVRGDPYKVQLVSKSANQALGKAEQTYNAAVKRAGNDANKIQKAKIDFTNNINRISDQMGGIQYTFDNKLYGAKATGESAYKYEISQIEDQSIRRTLASFSTNPQCSVFTRKPIADGGRVPYQTGTVSLNDCVKDGARNFKEGKFKTADQAQDAAKLLGGGQKILRGLMKYGILPEAAYVAGESVFRSVLGEEPLNALKKSIDTFSFGLTDFTSGIEAKKFGKDADRKLAVDKLRESQDKVNSIQQEIANLETLNTGSQFGYEGDQTKAIEMKKAQLQEAKKELQKNYVNPDIVKYIDRKAENIADAQMAKSGYAKASARDQMIGMPGVADYMDTDQETARVFPRQPSQMELNLNMLEPLPTNFLDDTTTELFQRSQDLRDQGFNVSTRDLIDYQKALKNMSLSQLAETYNPESIYGSQGVPSQPLAGGGIAKLAGIDDGPPPARGPNPQGLSYLMKRGKNT